MPWPSSVRSCPSYLIALGVGQMVGVRFPYERPARHTGEPVWWRYGGKAALMGRGAPAVGARRVVCPPGQHHWISGQQQRSWVICAVCGTPSICKGCEASQGRDVAGLPDVFCTLHANLAAQFARLPLTCAALVQRLVRLVGTAPAALWRYDAAGHLQRALVRRHGYSVEVQLATTHNQWQLIVSVPTQQPPVLLAEGPSSQLAVRHAQPGPWVQAVGAEISWRDTGVNP